MSPFESELKACLYEKPLPKSKEEEVIRRCGCFNKVSDFLSEDSRKSIYEKCLKEYKVD